MRNLILILLLFPVFLGLNAQIQTSLTLGIYAEKISEKDLFLPLGELNAEIYFNKWLSLSPAIRYGQIDNSRIDIKSWDAGLIVYFSPLTTQSYRLKIGGGVVYRNLKNKFLESWIDNGSDEESELLFSAKKYNTLGVQFNLESEWTIAKHLVIAPNIGYKYYFQELHALFFGVKIGYKF